MAAQPKASKGLTAVTKMKQAHKDVFYRKQDEHSKKFFIHADPVKLEQWRQMSNALLKKLDEDKDEVALLAAMRFMHSHKELPISRVYQLDKIEAEKCERKCQCINAKLPNPPELGKEYPYYSYFDEDKMVNKYVTFIDRTLAGSEQIPPELERKIADGWKPEQKDYPKPKKLVRRLIQSESEWFRYFKDISAINQEELKSFFED